VGVAVPEQRRNVAAGFYGVGWTTADDASAQHVTGVLAAPLPQVSVLRIDEAGGGKPQWT
jgi:hypothetical protein